MNPIRYTDKPPTIETTTTFENGVPIYRYDPDCGLSFLDFCSAAGRNHPKSEAIIINESSKAYQDYFTTDCKQDHVNKKSNLQPHT